MRIHTPTPRPREEGDFGIRVNPGDGDGPFAMIALSEDERTEICLDSLDDADRLVRAAVAAKRMLSAAIARQAHEFTGSPVPGFSGWCETCGMQRRNSVHQPAPKADS